MPLVPLPVLFAAACGVPAKNGDDAATHASETRHARSARPPGRLDERPGERASDLYAVSGPGKPPNRAASGRKPTSGATNLSAGAWIGEDALSAAGACCCKCWCCCATAAAAVSTTTALAFLRFGNISYY